MTAIGREAHPAISYRHQQLPAAAGSIMPDLSNTVQNSSTATCQTRHAIYCSNYGSNKRHMALAALH
jgi:hypothetical protein